MTRTRYGISPWIEQFPSTRRLDLPRFRATARAGPSASLPAVIVGGGVTGCCTAYALAAAGVKVVLLEAERIGTGGTSRSPGVLQGEATPSYRELEARHGRRAARAMFESSRRAVLDLASAVRRLGIKADLDVHDALRVLPPFSAGDKALAREVSLRKDVGLEAIALKPAATARESGIERSGSGVRFHHWGQADPYRLAVGFARAAIARGAGMFERSPVTRIKTARRHVEVQTAGGSVEADTVIICTGEPTDLFRPLKRHVRFEERYAVLTEKVPAAVRRQLASSRTILTDTLSPPHLVRWADDRLLVAGADQSRTAPRVRGKVLVQRTGQLMYELLRLYPVISGLMPAYGWDVPIATTADGAMYAGAHRNYPRHLFAWATRHDPAQAFLASRILLRHFSGEADKDDVYFAFTRG
jgi:glycine/D-amino acid oxidase-like deaminating enzyme